jgi:hypothetical protein
MDRPQKITFTDMRAQGFHGLLIYCADYRCGHSLAISGDRWPDDARLSDVEPRFIRAACGHRGADVRPASSLASASRKSSSTCFPAYSAAALD